MHWNTLSFQFQTVPRLSYKLMTQNRSIYAQLMKWWVWAPVTKMSSNNHNHSCMPESRRQGKGRRLGPVPLTFSYPEIRSLKFGTHIATSTPTGKESSASIGRLGGWSQRHFTLGQGSSKKERKQERVPLLVFSLARGHLLSYMATFWRQIPWPPKVHTSGGGGGGGEWVSSYRMARFWAPNLGPKEGNGLGFGGNTCPWVRLIGGRLRDADQKVVWCSVRGEFEHNRSRSSSFQVHPVTCWHLSVLLQ